MNETVLLAVYGYLPGTYAAAVETRTPASSAMLSTPCKCASKTECVCGPVDRTTNAIKVEQTDGVSVKVDSVYHDKLGVMVNPRHANVQSRFKFNEVYTVNVLRVRPDNGRPVEELEHTPEDTCERCKADRNKKLTIEQRREWDGVAHTCYADKGSKLKKPTGPCEPLFLRGVNPDNGFSRTIALRYLQKRMVFQPRSNAKGKADPAATVRDSKTSSSRHSTAFSAASDIEDIIHASWMIYKTGEDANGVRFDTVGNRLYDTCNACRRARTNMTRLRHRQRIEFVAEYAADLDERGHRPGATSARSIANRFYKDDAELDELMEMVTQHGWDNQKTLAAQLGVSEWQLCRRIALLRERMEREERLANR